MEKEKNIIKIVKLNLKENIIILELIKKEKNITLKVN